MTWLTLTQPQAEMFQMKDGAVIEAQQPPAPRFYIRADIVTEIIPGERETIIRTSTDAQYICAESAVDIMARIEEATEPQAPGLDLALG